MKTDGTDKRFDMYQFGGPDAEFNIVFEKKRRQVMIFFAFPEGREQVMILRGRAIDGFVIEDGDYPEETEEHVYHSHGPVLAWTNPDGAPVKGLWKK